MEKAQCPLRIVVIGAGLAGLTSALVLARRGHSVTVLESQSGISTAGAGIQIPPNSYRILVEYGLKVQFEKKAERAAELFVRRYADGQVLTALPQGSDNSWLIYRPDFQQLLYDDAIEAGVKVLFSVDVAPTGIQMVMDRYRADLLLVADGVGSKLREHLLQDQSPKPRVSSRAYRALVPRETMLKDPDTAKLITQSQRNIWAGPNRNIVTYPVSQGAYFNIVLDHPGEASPGSWTRPGDVQEMRASFSMFEPLVQKLLQGVESCLDWTLTSLPPLLTWTFGNGSIVLVGDAAHAMVPYLAQGAAMCVEDAAVIAECLCSISNKADLPQALAAYEDIRKDRTVEVQRESWMRRHRMSLPDGAEQERRDEIWKAGMNDAKNGRGYIEDPKFRSWLLDYNAIAHARDYLQRRSVHPNI